MNPLAPGAGWTVGIAVLAFLALVLFLLAVRIGRWGLWLAGYLCVVLAVLIAIFTGLRREVEVSGPVGPGAVTQRSAGSGVLHPVDRTGHSPSGMAATDRVI